MTDETDDYVHRSDCAIYNEPASPAGSCNCKGLDFNDAKDQEDDLILDNLPGQIETEILFQKVFDAIKDFIKDYRTVLTNKGEGDETDQKTEA